MAEEKQERMRYKYESAEAAKAAQRKQRHKWDVENYERTTVYFDKGMNERIKRVAEFTHNGSKRAFIIDALNAALKKAEKKMAAQKPAE